LTTSRRIVNTVGKDGAAGGSYNARAAEVQYGETDGVQQKGQLRLYGHGHIELAMRLITDESYVSSSYFLDVDKIIIDYNLSWM
jgi:hypothetical protein